MSADAVPNLAHSPTKRPFLGSAWNRGTQLVCPLLLGELFLPFRIKGLLLEIHFRRRNQ